MNDREKKAGTVPAAAASTERKEVAVTRVLGGSRQVRSMFHFDEVLTSFSTQQEVFGATLDPLVDEVLAGYEATAFAYGQTGTGKTYTMEGDLDCDDARGLVPRTAAAVIDRLTSGGYVDYSVSCQYLEIYNEELSDLLAPVERQQKLDLKDVGSGKGVVCTGLSEVAVQSCSDILDLVRRAQERRRVAETRINARSSRSHCIFTLKVKCRRAVASGELENTGKLHLVDLAGSECAKKAAWDDASAYPGAAKSASSMEEDRERKSINQSLLTLGRVISALRDGTGRVPYRDSKLTRLLQDALGGRCKTVVIATISPALNAVEETISTLTYAEQASGVKNRPVASSFLRTIRLAASGDPRCGCAAIGDGGALTGGDFAELEMKVAYLSQEVEEAQAALAMKYREVQEQLDRAARAEARLQDCEVSLSVARKESEEKAFVASRLAVFADGRCAVAAKLSGALDASNAHSEDLRSRLERSLSAAAAGRRQAQQLLEEAEARGGELSALGRSSAEEWSTLSTSAYSAHAASTGAAAEITKEQQRILASLISNVQGGSRSLEESLSSTRRDAASHIDADEACLAGFVDSVEARAREAAAAAARCGEEVDAAAAGGEAVAEQRAIGMAEMLDKSRQDAEASATGAKVEIEAARTSASSAHEAALQCVRSSIQAPLSELHRSLLTDATSLGSHTSSLGALKDAATSQGSASAKRWGQMLEQLGTDAKAHSEASSGAVEAARAALGSLQASLQARGEATDSSLASLGEALAAASSALGEASATRRGEASAALVEAERLLVESWTSQREMLKEMSSTLQSSAAFQRASNAADPLCAAATGAGAALGSALAAAVAELGVVRDAVEAQVAELQERRRAEQEIVDKLAKQRKALQADIGALQSELGEVGAELEATRGGLAESLGAQERARAELFEATTAFLREGLSNLGSSLGTATSTASSRLSAAEGRLEAAAGAAGASAERSSGAVEEATASATAWSTSIGAGCDAISEAQERLKKGYESVDAVSKDAAERLAGIEATAKEWGAKCEEVAVSIDAADAKRSDLMLEGDRLEPAWRGALLEASSALESWSEDVRHATDELGAIAETNIAARGELEQLRTEVSGHHAASMEGVALTERSSQAHAEALTALAAMGAGYLGEDGQVDDERQFSIEELRLKAEGLTHRAEQHISSGDALLGAVSKHLEAMPGDFRAPDAALAGAAEAIARLASEHGGAAARAAAGAEALREAQADLAKTTRQSASEAFAAASAAAEASMQATAAHREASKASGVARRALWSRAADAQRDTLSALGAQCDTAKEQQAAATSAGSRVIVDELEKGAQAQDRATAASKELASGLASALAADRASLRSSLSAPPLQIFDEPAAAVASAPARPEAAVRPADLELLPRPSEESLLESLRRTEAGAAFGKENDPALRGPAAVKQVLDFEATLISTKVKGGRKVSELLQPEGGPGGSPNGSPRASAGASPTGVAAQERRVLGVLNKA